MAKVLEDALWRAPDAVARLLFCTEVVLGSAPTAETPYTCDLPMPCLDRPAAFLMYLTSAPTRLSVWITALPLPDLSTLELARCLSFVASRFSSSDGVDTQVDGVCPNRGGAVVLLAAAEGSISGRAGRDENIYVRCL